VTATVSSEGISELPQRLVLLVQKDVRVDRHRDLNVRMTDIPDHVRRGAKVEQERHAGTAEVMKPGLAKPGFPMAYQLRRRLSGSIGVPRREG
jgi:hypothetical protein